MYNTKGPSGPLFVCQYILMKVHLPVRYLFMKCVHSFNDRTVSIPFSLRGPTYTNSTHLELAFPQSITDNG